MFGFLMLKENFFIVKFTITIPTPWFRLFLFLSTHFYLPKIENLKLVISQ